MSFEKDFLDMMPHTITILNYLRDDFSGAPVYDEDNPRTYRCRIVGKGISLRTRQGEDDTVIFDIYADMKGDPLKQEDKIVLPADVAWNDQTPLIFAIGRYPDEDSHHHVKIQCGWMYHRQGQ